MAEGGSEATNLPKRRALVPFFPVVWPLPSLFIVPVLIGVLPF